jgi:exodeoxyribonuclease VII small subunit
LWIFIIGNSVEQVTRQRSHLLLQQIYGHLLREVALQSQSGAFLLPKFEECLQRLEKIVQELEKGDAPLEKSLTLFEEGMQLSTACRKELEQAEGKVEILLKQNGKLQAVPFESENEKISSRR